MSQKFDFAVRKGNMLPERKEELLASVKDVADGVYGVAKHFEANFGLDSSFLILRWTDSYEITVDMCVYYISSETLNADGRMDIHYATCCSKITHATEEQKKLVRQRVSEVIVDAVKDMEIGDLYGGK